MSQMLKEIENHVSPLFGQNQVELIDITYQKDPGGWTLCFFLDKPGGISLDDCQEWSRKLGDALEGGNLIPHSYNLEVSSPGIYRVLKKEKDFLKFSGERVSIKLFSPMNGQKKFSGVLLGIDQGQIKIQIEGNGETRFSLDQIAKVNLDPHIDI